MVHSSSIILTNLKVEFAAVLGSIPGWFHFEFVRKLLGDELPEGVDAGGPGKLAAEMWLVDWCNQSCTSPLRLHALVYGLRAAYVRSTVFTTTWGNEYSFASFRARELGIELMSDLRLVPRRTSQVHVTQHTRTRDETLLGQLWLENDDADALPLLVVEVTMNDAMSTTILLNVDRLGDASLSLDLLGEHGFVLQQSPDISVDAFNVDMVHLIRQGAMVVSRTNSSMTCDFGQGRY